MEDELPEQTTQTQKVAPIIVPHLSEMFPNIPMEKLEWALEQIRERWRIEAMARPAH